MRITDRYAAATRSSCLTVDARTTYSDTDVLAGMGLAARALTAGRTFGGASIPPAPLAAPLERLFTGDNSAVSEIVAKLSELAWKQARTLGVKLQRAQAVDIARACLAWHRDGVCKACGGHGKLLIPGTRTIGSTDCKACKGEGRVPFEQQMRVEWRELARWLVAAMQREQAKAGPEAMKWIAPRLEL